MAKVVLVRHGPGIGRGYPYLQVALDHLARTRPQVMEHVVPAYTGQADPSLEDVGAVVFWLGDPLRECYPDCYGQAKRIADHARAIEAKVVNPPEALSNTIKSVQSRRWREAGLRTPEALPFTTFDQMHALLRDTAYPAIIRPDWLHGQQKMHFCHNRREAEKIPRTSDLLPGVVVPWIDTREGYRHQSPQSAWARRFHKKRSFVFGQHVINHHVFFSNQPLVGGGTSTFGWYTGRKAALAPLARLSPTERLCLDEDWAYYNQPADQPRVMRRAAEALGLDFIALDYAVDAQGQVILWEANPYFVLKSPERGRMPGVRRLYERIPAYFDRIGQFLADLTAEEGPSQSFPLQDSALSTMAAA